jgi:phage gpG-like protein
MARDLKYFDDDMKRQAKQIAGTIKKDLPRVIGVEGKNHFENSWRHQGFKDEGINRWKPRKAPPKLTESGKISKAYLNWKRKNNRPILYSHGSDRKGIHLKDSIRAIPGIGRVTFATSKPYAKVHNEGGRAGRGKGFRMPKRQFMGRSRTLDRRIETKATQLLNKKLK